MLAPVHTCTWPRLSPLPGHLCCTGWPGCPSQTAAAAARRPRYRSIPARDRLARAASLVGSTARRNRLQRLQMRDGLGAPRGLNQPRPTLTSGSQPVPCSTRRQHSRRTKNCQAAGCCRERLLPLPPLGNSPASRPSRSCLGCCTWLRTPASRAVMGPVGERAASRLKPRRSQKKAAAASNTLSAIKLQMRAEKGWRQIRLTS